MKAADKLPVKQAQMSSDVPNILFIDLFPVGFLIEGEIIPEKKMKLKRKVTVKVTFYLGWSSSFATFNVLGEEGRLLLYN